MVRFINKPQISKVNARHLLDDLASSYSYSVEEAVLVELIANALDAKSTSISISTNASRGSVTLIDNGVGMDLKDFERYHDLAESRKEKGTGIGFAGLGAKLAHKISSSVETETRSDGDHQGSEWRLRANDLEWINKRFKALKYDGTKVTLHLRRRHKQLLDSEFISDTVKHHYAALFDPFLSEVYVWEAIYPKGITISVNGQEIPQSPVVSNDIVESRTEIDLLTRRKRRIGRAVFILTSEPIPEDAQGIWLATYGKSIRIDSLSVHALRPEYVTGWVEAPELVECLTLNKQDFSTSGSNGEKFRRVRREVQRAFSQWLRDIGEAHEPSERRRVSRVLERETATIIQRIPQLRYLYGSQLRDLVHSPDESGDELATNQALIQPTFGLGEGQGGQDEAPDATGSDEGEAPVPNPEGEIQTRVRPRTVRGGPRIDRVSYPDRMEISWLEADTVIINTAHPTYTMAERRRLIPYHERFAVFFALCQEAPAEPEERMRLLNQVMTEWGRSQAK